MSRCVFARRGLPYGIGSIPQWESVLTHQPLIKAFKDKLDQRVVFVDNREDKDVRELLRIAVSAYRSLDYSRP